MPADLRILGAWGELSLMVNREVSDQTCPSLPAGTQGNKNNSGHEQHIFCKVLGLGESFWEQGATRKVLESISGLRELNLASKHFD